MKNRLDTAVSIISAFGAGKGESLVGSFKLDANTHGEQSSFVSGGIVMLTLLANAEVLYPRASCLTVLPFFFAIVDNLSANV